MKRHLITTTLLTGLLLTSSASLAQGKPDLNLKSVGTAWLLGLDPIPGDALFYAGKPVQGTVNMILGSATAVAFFGGIAMMVDPGDDDPGDVYGIGSMSALVGGIGYISMLLWDAGVGISGVYDHNRRAQEQVSSLWQRVQPSVAVTNDGAFGSVSLKF